MPVYEYRHKQNTQCDFDTIQQRITEDKLTVCPKCNKPIERIISVTNPPILKGTGFYQTDYKNKGK